MSTAYELWDRDQLLKEYYSDRSVEGGFVMTQLVGWGVATAEGLLPTDYSTYKLAMHCFSYPYLLI